MYIRHMIYGRGTYEEDYSGSKEMGVKVVAKSSHNRYVQ